MGRQDAAGLQRRMCSDPKNGPAAPVKPPRPCHERTRQLRRMTTIPAALVFWLVALNGEPAEAQQAPVAVADFWVAPGASDNPTCPQMQPCSPQGAAMACQAQPIQMCRIWLADGLYLGNRRGPL